MKKIMLLLAVSAMVVVLFAPMATARQHRDDATTMTATASGTATASSTATASGTAAGGGGGGGGKKGDKLPKTGGPAPMALLSGVILAGSGVVAWSYLRRREVS